MCGTSNASLIGASARRRGGTAMWIVVAISSGTTTSDNVHTSDSRTQ